MTPGVFSQVNGMTAVHAQPKTAEERKEAFQALLACPTCVPCSACAPASAVHSAAAPPTPLPLLTSSSRAFHALLLLTRLLVQRTAPVRSKNAASREEILRVGSSAWKACGCSHAPV